MWHFSQNCLRKFSSDFYVEFERSDFVFYLMFDVFYRIDLAFSESIFLYWVWVRVFILRNPNVRSERIPECIWQCALKDTLKDNVLYLCIPENLKGRCLSGRGEVSSGWWTRGVFGNIFLRTFC